MGLYVAILPAVGTEEFRCLSYKQQLEIASLQLFDPDEYNRQIGTSQNTNASIDLLDYGLISLPDIDLPDLPVAFIDNYWAGYSAKYKAEWYSLCSPLDEYNICWRRMVNVYAFNFPFIGMLPAIYYIVTYLRRRFFTSSFTIITLIHACKVFIYLDHVLRDNGAHYLFSKWAEIRDKADSRLKAETSALRLYQDALDCMDNIYSLSDVNSIQETIENNKSILYSIQQQTLVVHPMARSFNGRWFFPLIPRGLYNDGRFHIYNWGWLQQHE